MYARKYALADFIEPSDALDDGRKLLSGRIRSPGDTESDDDAALYQLTSYSNGARTSHQSSAIRSSSHARPPFMQTPADLSFVGTVGGAGVSK